MNNRIAYAKDMQKQVKHAGNILLLGCGAIARASLPLLFQLIDFDPKKLTIIDFADTRNTITDYLNQGVIFKQEKITPENYKSILSRTLTKGDLLLDLSWNIDTCDLLTYCHEHGILYVNTSIEEWNPYQQFATLHESTLYYRHQVIRKLLGNWHNTISQPTAILDHGANPGMISHLVKKGLCDIVTQKLIPSEKLVDHEKDSMLSYIKNNQFNLLAQKIGLKVVHISERDTQISNDPKKPDEFVNTWSVEGLIEEGLAPAELGWGTHEKALPPDAFTHPKGNRNQIFLKSRGMNTLMKSWIKSGPIIGMLIRHGESYSISDRLAVFPDEQQTSYIHHPLRHHDRKLQALYRPTVHYVYCPSDSALASLHEFRMHNYERQKKQRILYNDIISGTDELGCLLMGDFGVWWVGSLLSIEEARAIIDPKKNKINATSLQVASSFVASAIYALRHPNVGICMADDIDHREILELASPFWGEIWSGEIKLSPDEAQKIREYQFEDFHVTEQQ
ncbi:MAG: saccharopine dehydrogenase NADP-binding domain-containing protein [Candidatus Babeliales bacterium]